MGDLVSQINPKLFLLNQTVDQVEDQSPGPPILIPQIFAFNCKD